MRATIEVCTISGFPTDDHMGFPLSCWHRTTYVPVPEQHGVDEPTEPWIAIWVNGHEVHETDDRPNFRGFGPTVYGDVRRVL